MLARGRQFICILEAIERAQVLLAPHHCGWTACRGAAAATTLNPWEHAAAPRTESSRRVNAASASNTLFPSRRGEVEQDSKPEPLEGGSSGVAHRRADSQPSTAPGRHNRVKIDLFGIRPTPQHCISVMREHMRSCRVMDRVVGVTRLGKALKLSKRDLTASQTGVLSQWISALAGEVQQLSTPRGVVTALFALQQLHFVGGRCEGVIQRADGQAVVATLLDMAESFSQQMDPREIRTVLHTCSKLDIRHEGCVLAASIEIEARAAEFDAIDLVDVSMSLSRLDFQIDATYAAIATHLAEKTALVTAHDVTCVLNAFRRAGQPLGPLLPALSKHVLRDVPFAAGDERARRGQLATFTAQQLLWLAQGLGPFAAETPELFAATAVAAARQASRMDPAWLSALGTVYATVGLPPSAARNGVLVTVADTLAAQAAAGKLDADVLHKVAHCANQMAYLRLRRRAAPRPVLEGADPRSRHAEERSGAAEPPDDSHDWALASEGDASDAETSDSEFPESAPHSPLGEAGQVAETHRLRRSADDAAALHSLHALEGGDPRGNAVAVRPEDASHVAGAADSGGLTVRVNLAATPEDVRAATCRLLGALVELLDRPGSYDALTPQLALRTLLAMSKTGVPCPSTLLGSFADRFIAELHHMPPKSVCTLAFVYTQYGVAQAALYGCIAEYLVRNGAALPPALVASTWARLQRVGIVRPTAEGARAEAEDSVPAQPAPLPAASLQGSSPAA